MKIVCLSSQYNGGKNETARILAKAVPGPWAEVSFADEVKDIFCRTFGVTRAFIEKWKRIGEPPPGFLLPVRQGLQVIGDGFRNIMEDCWIRLALSNCHGNAVITDGRYWNEARVVEERGGVNVLLWRPGHENSDPNRSEAEVGRLVRWCVETGQDGPIRHLPDEPEGMRHYHYFLRNDGDVDHLRSRVSMELAPFLLSRFSESVQAA